MALRLAEGARPNEVLLYRHRRYREMSPAFIGVGTQLLKRGLQHGIRSLDHLEKQVGVQDPDAHDSAHLGIEIRHSAFFVRDNNEKTPGEDTGTVYVVSLSSVGGPCEDHVGLRKFGKSAQAAQERRFHPSEVREAGSSVGFAARVPQPSRFSIPGTHAFPNLRNALVGRALGTGVSQLGRCGCSDAEGPRHLDAPAPRALPREQSEASSLRDARAVIARRASTGDMR